jgi:hypothetical protein
MKNLIANRLISWGQYDPIDLRAHYDKYKLCLNQLTAKDLNIKENFTRITSQDPSCDSLQNAQNLLKVFNNVEDKQSFLEFSEEVYDTINTLSIDKRISATNVLVNAQTLVNNSSDISALLNESLINCQKDKLKTVNEFSNILEPHFVSGDIPILYKLLQFCNINEIITFTAVEHKIILLITLRVYVPYMYSVYVQGNFKLILKNLIANLNFRTFTAKTRLFLTNPNTYAHGILGLYAIQGLFFNVKVPMDISVPAKQLQDTVDVLKERYKVGGLVGQWITTSQRLVGQVSYSITGYIRSFYEGVALSALEKANDVVQVASKDIIVRK